MKVLSVFGTRPEAIKMCPLVKVLDRTPGIESMVCVTAQHRQMLDQVLEAFSVTPDFDLDIMSRSQTLTPLIDRFQQQEGITREHARENVIYLVNELLIPYFASQPHFLRTSHAGRLAWLNNLLKSAHGAHLIAQAAQACRTRRLAQAAENRSRLRDNHPLSPHEWTDPATSSRFYDDEDEGMVPIPADAPPRPSDTAVWNVISKEWRQ